MRLAGTCVAAVLMLGALLGGPLGLGLLVAGVLVLDVSMQSGMVANVTRMYRSRRVPGVRLPDRDTRRTAAGQSHR